LSLQWFYFVVISVTVFSDKCISSSNDSVSKDLSS
jgi:hypothetical protein